MHLPLVTSSVLATPTSFSKLLHSLKPLLGSAEINRIPHAENCSPHPSGPQPNLATSIFSFSSGESATAAGAMTAVRFSSQEFSGRRHGATDDAQTPNDDP